MTISVNGDPISSELIDAEFGQIKAHYERMGNMSCCERDDEFLGYAKENLIAKALLSQLARESMPAPSDKEIDEAIAKAKEEHGGEESFYFNLGIAPGQEAGIRPQVAESIQFDNLLLSITATVPSPTEEELESFYKDNIDQFSGQEEVRASHIFRQVERVEDREGILEELHEIRKQALAGKDFEELAREHTDKGEDEIDLGFFKRGELMDEFEIMAFSMELNEISPTLSSPWGLHLAKLTDRKAPAPIPLDECREDVTEMMKQQRNQDAVQVKVDELRESAKIEEVSGESE